MIPLMKRNAWLDESFYNHHNDKGWVANLQRRLLYPGRVVNCVSASLPKKATLRDINGFLEVSPPHAFIGIRFSDLRSLGFRDTFIIVIVAAFFVVIAGLANLL